MKKTLSLILAVMMLLGCMSVTAFAAENDKSGDTTITAKKVTPFSYEIVFPTNVAEITKAGAYMVGQAKVTKVAGATEKTVISYTATTEDFKCEGKSDLPATYHTEEAATNAFPTTAVTVYENKADAASIPTMWVKIADADWTAAADGTYTATVTFNFEAKEAEPVAIVTIADILPDDFPDSQYSSWWTGGCACDLYATGGNLCAAGGYTVSVPVATVLTPTSGDYDYTCTVDGITWKFAMSGDEFCKVNISGAEGEYFEVNGDYNEVN